MRARNSDPHTSHEAAALAVSHAEAILDILPPTGMTTEEIASTTGIGIQCVSPQMKPMEKRGEVFRIQVGVKANGKPIYDVRENAKSGRKAILWFPNTEEARAYRATIVEWMKPAQP
jgi:hypothetical protein